MSCNASQTLVHACRFMECLMEKNGVSKQEVKHMYSSGQECAFLYHPKISVILFRPDDPTTTTYLKMSVLDPVFIPTDTVIEQGKKKTEIQTSNLTESVWKHFRVFILFFLSFSCLFV
jgi:hypothetical protein